MVHSAGVKSMWNLVKWFQCSVTVLLHHKTLQAQTMKLPHCTSPSGRYFHVGKLCLFCSMHSTEHSSWTPYILFNRFIKQYSTAMMWCSLVNFRCAGVLFAERTGFLLSILSWTLCLFSGWSPWDAWTEVFASSSVVFVSLLLAVSSSVLCIWTHPGWSPLWRVASVLNCLHLMTIRLTD